jgi:nickel transport protein
VTHPRSIAATLALAAAAAFPSFAGAHGFWFAERSKQFAMIFGVGADDLDMVKRMPKVTSFAAYDADGKEVPSKLTVTGPIVLVDVSANPEFLAATMDYGTWSKAPDGEWYEKGKDEVPGATVSEKNYKYGVNIRGKLTKAVPLLPNQKLQIVPVGAAIPEKMGQPIKLKVYYDGKPAAGARILHDWVNDPDDKGVKTAKDGTVTIKVRNQGLNVIVAVYNTPPENPAKTNTVEHLASLSFVLPHEPE